MSTIHYKWVWLVAGSVAAIASTAKANDSPAQSAERTPGIQAPAQTTVASVERGQRVRLEGKVLRVLDHDEFRLADDTGSIRVYLPAAGPSPVKVGQQVFVEGVVDDDLTFGLTRPEVYATSLQIVDGSTLRFEVTRPDVKTSDVRERRAADEGGHSAIASLARGHSATISGTVTRILDTDEFRLDDDTGSIRVYIGWRNTLPVEVGDRVAVTGTLDDDIWPIRPEFYAETITPHGQKKIDLRLDKTPLSASGEQGAGLKHSRPTDRTPIDQLRPYETVLIKGKVARITDEDEFRLRDDSGSIGVYIGWRNPMPVSEGDDVSVVGIVDSEGPWCIFREVYAYELTTADGRTVPLQAARLSQPAAARAKTETDAAQNGLTPIPVDQVRRGQSVVLRGVVDRIRDTDEFRLRDDSGTIQVYIGWRNRMPVATGDRITVFGVADDDVFPGARPEIYADRITLADGRTVVLQRGGYRDE